MAETPTWMDDPMVKHIDRKKLEFLGGLVFNGHGKNQKEMMPYVMNAMKQAKSNNVSFTSAEISAIITAIKKHSSPEELKKIDEIMKKAPHG